jgi:aminoglycoside/choline kinase family phosphotransferase
MTKALADAGRPLLDEPRPFFLRGISALLRGPTAAGDVFLKAVFPPFHPEPAATRLLAERFPGTVPNVIAIDADEGWLLIDDLAAPWIGELAAETRTAGLRAGAEVLVVMQRTLVGDLAPFVAAGCPDRPLAGLADDLDAALGPDGVAHVEGDVSRERRARAVDATRRAVGRVGELGMPDTIVHGDFHAGNAAFRDGRAVIIDWSDAAISNPAIDLVTWLAWSKGEPDQQQAAIDAWIGAWASPTDPAALRERLDDILIVGAAYQVVSYDAIVRALEPLTRYTMAGGASTYLERLEDRLDGKPI